MGQNTITLSEYLSKAGDTGCFVIPNYQRGYVWGQYKAEYKVDSVTNMLNTLITGFNNRYDVFVQGITVYEETAKTGDQDIYLVDGQQRTTFFYLLLQWLGYDKHFSLTYSIRKESNQFLAESLKEEITRICQISEEEYLRQIQDEKYQDIFFFKKTLVCFQRLLSGIEKSEFKDYILDRVRFLYIKIIDKKQANIIFTMMNGQKAPMEQEELVKAELLRCASLSGGKIGEAENVMIRNRFAREWDQWLYWWNRTDVSNFFRTIEKDGGRPKIMGWLLPLTLGNKDVSFEDYREKRLKDQNKEMVSVREAKSAFKDLRLLQKQVEDAYNNPIVYNYMGAILCWLNGSEERFTFLDWYFKLKRDNTDNESCIQQLKRYFDWSMLGVTHQEIVRNAKDVFERKYCDFLETLQGNNLYKEGYEQLSRWLLCRNINEDNTQGDNGMGRKFDFEIWRNRSLEHIFAKSKVWHMSEDGVPLNYNEERISDRTEMDLISDKSMVRREEMFVSDSKGEKKLASEHSIGNLVLLYKRDNSEFNDANFDRKKEIFFGTNDEAFFKSRHLIHTIKIFARSTWTPCDIAENKVEELKNFENYYSIYLINNENGK